MKPRSPRPQGKSSFGSKGGFDKKKSFGGKDRAGPGRPLNETPRAFYGVLEIGKKGIFVRPASRQQKFTVELDKKYLNGGMDGEIVFVRRSEIKKPPVEGADLNAEKRPGKAKPAKEFKNGRWLEPGEGTEPEEKRGPRFGPFEVAERLGSSQDVRNYSLLSLLEAGLQPSFPPKVVDACYGFTVPELGDREDLRQIPLVTIDGEDARDFDDAVFAEPDTDNGGWHAIIAIADVAHYVTPGSDLDKEALRRGNSTYFPDRVVPMLPERLSNDLCSLRPNEDRACMHVHVWIDEKGEISDWKVGRGLMRSHARLTYNQVQLALDGQPEGDALTMLPQLQNLYKIFQALQSARKARGALEINSPERKVIMDGEGGVAAIVPRESLEAHKLIEELMITANVIVATALESKEAPCMYRIHDRPSALKIMTLSQFIKPLGLELPAKGIEVEGAMFNEILRKAATIPDLAPVINDLVLRCQSQAVYTDENIGHYGLALDRYAHFTSPIRRYADLINHRSLIRAFDLGENGLQEREESMMKEWGERISTTERASMLAERACVDRFTAHFLQTQIGKEITGRISSVTSFGLFVSLLDGVGEALIPMRLLPQDFYDFIEEKQALVGQRSGRVYRLGGRVSLTIMGVDPVLGSVTGQLLGTESANTPGHEHEVYERQARPFGQDRYNKPRDRDEGPRPPYKGGRDSKPYAPRERSGEDRPRYDRGGDDRPRFDRGGEDRPKRPYTPRDGGGERSSSYGDRPKRPYAPRDDRGGEDRPKRPYTPRDGGGERSSSYGDRPKRPYAPRDDRGGEDRPKRAYTPRDGGGERSSSYGDRPKRPYAPRDDRGGEDRPKRAYTPRDGGGERSSSYGDRPKRPYAPRDDRGGEDRPKRAYTPRDGGGERSSSYGDRPKRPYAPRDDRGGEDRPKRAYTPRDGGGERSSSYGDRPKRPYTPRDGGGDDRPKRSYGARDDAPRGGGDRGKPSYGERKSYGDRPQRSDGPPSRGGQRSGPGKGFAGKPSGGYKPSGGKGGGFKGGGRGK